MKVLKSALTDQLVALMAPGGTYTVQQLQDATGKSQPSISLALGKLGSQVCKLGAARSTRYALTQTILGLPATQTLTWTTPQGQQKTFGSLYFLHGGQVHVRCTRGAEGAAGTKGIKGPSGPKGPKDAQWVSPANKLPWFLQTLRPQGFLGRQLTGLRRDFASDPDSWRTEQVLYMAINHVSDPPGALHLGEGGERLTAPTLIGLQDLPQHLDALARAVTLTLPARSSAGGEQPKFLTVMEVPGGQPRHVIVKFTPPHGTPFGTRWHDLLHLEHLALTVLEDHGVAVAATQIVQSQERTYLVSERFDRIGLYGKRHVVAAAAVHDAFVQAPRRHWVASCEVLVAQRQLTEAHLATVAATYLFGQYIGNTDMHFGNLSFFVDDVVQPTLVPTPVYDMLPMMWRPGVHTGELGTQPVPASVQPAGYAELAATVRNWARIFWERAAALPELSPALRAASAENARLLGP